MLLISANACVNNQCENANPMCRIFFDGDFKSIKTKNSSDLIFFLLFGVFNVTFFARLEFEDELGLINRLIILLSDRGKRFWDGWC